MKRNLPVFKIPAKVLEDPELSEYIDSLMRDIRTKQQAIMKTKVGKTNGNIVTSTTL